MKNFIYVLVAGICLFPSCTKNNSAKNPAKGVFQVCIDYGCTSPMTTANCEDVIGFIQNNPGVGAQQIHVQGHFPDNSVLSLDLLWNGQPTANTFSLDENKIGIGNWGVGFYDLALGKPEGYHTADGGTGTATVTAYDAVNQRISGTFSFRAKYFDGNAFQNKYRDFSGSFVNVPIIDPANPQSACNGTAGNPGGGTGNSSGTGTQQSVVGFSNNSFTDISITVAGIQKVVTPGNTVSFSGVANSAYSGTAGTTGKTSSGTQVGLPVSWTLKGNFPGSGTMTTRLDVSADYFFVKLANQSGKPITKIYSNYQTSAQTMENLTIPSDARTYSLGYYKAYINSNVRAEAGSAYWNWNPLTLRFTVNQSVTLTANP
jgi:hypothetical protein